MALVETTAPSITPRERHRRIESLWRIRSLFEWRSNAGFGPAEAVALFLFFGVGSYALRYHEKWGDEAQAWLIARDDSLWQIFRSRLHYEGSPPLWHSLLHVFHALGGSYQGMGWLSLCIATAGIFVWLRWSPFPSVIRYLLPYSFFLQYQYAVIARSYVLFPLLTFLVCILFSRPRRILWFALVDGILANVSLQGFTVALAFATLYVIRQRQHRSWSLDGFPRGEASPRAGKSRAATAIFGILICTAIYCAIPAPDLNFAIGDQISSGEVHTVLMHLIGETPRNAPPSAPAATLILSPSVETAPSWRTQPGAWLASIIFPQSLPRDHYVIRWIMSNVGPRLVEFAEQATWPISQSNMLACAFLVTLVLWLRARRCLRLLLPWLSLMVVGQILWIAEHHSGMLLIVLVAGCWLAFDSGEKWHHESSSDRIFVGILAVVLAVQCGWSLYCIHADVVGSYDPGPETAQWLKKNPRSRIAAFGFATVSTQPWFSHSPFFNVPTAYWQWSSNVEVDAIHHATIATRPGLVVYGLEFPGSDDMRDQWLPQTHISLADERNLPRDLIVKDLHENGYRETHRFCGTRFARFSSVYRVCDIIFEPVPDLPGSPNNSSTP